MTTYSSISELRSENIFRGKQDSMSRFARFQFSNLSFRGVVFFKCILRSIPIRANTTNIHIRNIFTADVPHVLVLPHSITDISQSRRSQQEHSGRLAICSSPRPNTLLLSCISFHRNISTARDPLGNTCSTNDHNMPSKLSSQIK